MQTLSSKDLQKNAYGNLQDLEIVIAGYVGETGLKALLSQEEMRQKAAEGISGKTLMRAMEPVKEILSEAAVAGKSGGEMFIRVEEEGIYDTLYKIAEAGDVGLSVYLRQIPIRQEVIEVCNALEKNPYYLDSTGVAVILTNRAFTLQQLLTEEGIPAKAAGFLTKSKDKVILSGEKARMGQHRNYLFPPGSAKANLS